MTPPSRAASTLFLLSLITLLPAYSGWAQASLPAGAPRTAEPIPGLDAYVQRSMEGWRAPGVSLVIVRGDSVSTRAYGVTEAGGRDPVTPETLFGIGSLSKAFTATLIAMLVDEGRVGWDDPVVRHLPGFAMHDPYVTRHLTVRDVLSHRTGLDGDDLMWVAGARSPEELVRRLRFQRPAVGFRARFGYHNVLYLLAGELAEEVTGESWGELMRRRIFEPLGMKRSSATLRKLRRRSDVALPHDEVGPGQILGTVPSAEVPLDAPTQVRRIAWFDPVTVPAGGIASSAKEFGSWLRFQLGAGELDGRRLLDADTLLETRTPQTPLPGFSRNQGTASVTNLGAYGMGWGVRDYRGWLMVTHLGSTRWRARGRRFAMAKSSVSFQEQDMRITLPFTNALLAVLVCAGCGDEVPEASDATPSAADSLTGLWKFEDRETLAPDGSVTQGSPVWENFILFTPEHYSMNWAGGPDSVSSYDEPFRPTEEEALARYGSLVVNAGRYTASGGTLTIEPTFALVPEFVGGSGTFEYRLSGDTLSLRWTKIFAADGTPDPLTAQGYSFQYRFLRVD